jgi:hypothetical protein
MWVNHNPALPYLSLATRDPETILPLSLLFQAF